MRFFFFLILLSIAFTAPLWFFALVAVLYAFRYPALELIVLGMLLDALYGVGTFLYLYTTSGALLFVIAEWVKPSLLFYDTAA